MVDDYSERNQTTVMFPIDISQSTPYITQSRNTNTSTSVAHHRNHAVNRSMPNNPAAAYGAFVGSAKPQILKKNVANEFSFR